MKTIKLIANDINELMRKNGKDVITIKWPQFYILCDRTRLADIVMSEISEELKKNEIYIIYAKANIIIAKDFCFSPVKDAVLKEYA